MRHWRCGPTACICCAPGGDTRAEGEVTLCTWLGSVVEHVVQLGPDTTVLTRGPALGRDAVRRHAPGTRVALSWSGTKNACSTAMETL